MNNTNCKDNYILLPNNGEHNCFGCSPVNTSGLQMKFYTNANRDLVVSWLSVPDHCGGWTDVVHGGIIATIFDETMGWASLVILQKVIMSKSLKVDYIKPIKLNKEIRIESTILEINNDREATVQGFIYDDENELCAQAVNIFSLFTLETIRKMGIHDEKMLSLCDQIMNKK